MPAGPCLYHSGQYVQSLNSQMLHRQALMSKMQGSAGASAQRYYLTYREIESSNQIPIQGSPQSFSLRLTDRQSLLPPDQGVLSIGLIIGAQGGTSNPQSDLHSGSELFANMAIQHQPSRCAAVLTQQLGNYLITSPRTYYKQSIRSYCHDCNSREIATFHGEANGG